MSKNRIHNHTWLSRAILFFICALAFLSGNAQYNTNLGYKAGDAISTGQKNVMVGERAGETNNGTGNIFIGSNAGQNDTVSNTLIISNDTIRNTIYGDLLKRRVAIATNEFPSDTTYRLAVEGKVIAREFKATQSILWPDYVFQPNYDLMPLSNVQQYIENYFHLPNVPSASDIEKNGLELAKMNAILLRKVEELTLYIIELDQKTNTYQTRVEQLTGAVNKLEILVEESNKDKSQRRNKQ